MKRRISRDTFTLYWLCILNNKILFGIHRQKFSFVIENRDITDFLSTYFCITFLL